MGANGDVSELAKQMVILRPAGCLSQLLPGLLTNDSMPTDKEI